jgi:hypothetical protein
MGAFETDGTVEVDGFVAGPIPATVPALAGDRGETLEGAILVSEFRLLVEPCGRCPRKGRCSLGGGIAITGLPGPGLR